jgi:hypothetical protein
MNLFMFDVESTSLHGSGFAVGAVVMTSQGAEVDRFELLSLEGASKAGEWVKENVLPSLRNMPTCETDRELRDRFFEFYMRHKETAQIWSDVNFPVETNFLHKIVKDDPEKREWLMPYPLYDASTIVPVEIDRNEASKLTGLRKHNPLDDSIASLTVLLNYLSIKDDIKVKFELV